MTQTQVEPKQCLDAVSCIAVRNYIHCLPDRARLHSENALSDAKTSCHTSPNTGICVQGAQPFHPIPLRQTPSVAVPVGLKRPSAFASTFALRADWGNARAFEDDERERDGVKHVERIMLGVKRELDTFTSVVRVRLGEHFVRPGIHELV